MISAETKTKANVKQAVPFFGVSNMEESLRFYVEGLGFVMTKKWIPDGNGKIRWCWLEIGGASLMLQEFHKEGHDSWKPSCKVGEGVSVSFQCEDALAIYHEATARGIKVRRNPFVGNSMWVVPFSDPDGYHFDFDSYTDVPEETEFSPPEK
jgi:lactoylglutathione lyase